MTRHSCPGDGCEYEGDSIAALRAHVNAKADHAEWSELKHNVEGDENKIEDAEEQEPEGEADREQTEAGQTSEYAEQWEEEKSSSEQSEEKTDDAQERTDDVADGSDRMGSGAALAAGSLLLALIVVLTKENDEPEEVPSSSADVPESGDGAIEGWGGTAE